MLFVFSGGEVAVNGLDNHLFGPGPVVIAVIEFERRAFGLNLLEGQSAFDHVVDSISNDRDYVAILDNVGEIRNASVARNDVGRLPACLAEY